MCILFSVSLIAHAEEASTNFALEGAIIYGSSSVSEKNLTPFGSLFTNQNVTGVSEQWQDVGAYTAVSMVLYDSVDGELLEKNTSASISVNNLYMSGSHYLVDTAYPNNFYDVKYKYVYKDNTQSNLESANAQITYNESYFSLKFDVTPDKDVTSISILMYFDIDHFFNITIPSGDYINLDIGSSNTSVSVDVDEEKTLLGKLLDWVKNIYDSVKSIPTYLTNIWNTIKNLPSDIWQFIEDGLKKLFVPDEAYLTEYSNKWDTLLADRFGLVYESFSMAHDVVTSIEESDAQNILMPSVTIHFGDTPFTFGGYEVDPVPDKFEFLADACKLVTSIVCTYLFINGLLHRYDEVMGVVGGEI